MASLEGLRGRCRILDGAEAQTLRLHFDAAFVVPPAAAAPPILRWDMIRWEPCTEDELWERVSARERVYLMWDLATLSAPAVAASLEASLEAVAEAAATDIARVRGELLDEDVYLFDDSFSWLGILTHEWSHDPPFRWCGWLDA